MKQSIRDRVKLWWFNVRERFLWSIVKRCVKRIDKMNCGAFMAFSWGVDEHTDYHVIAERSLENCHVYGTRVEYYEKQEGERKDNETKLKGEKTMEKNCIDCVKSVVFDDGVIECEADKYDINTKSCFVPKICKVEKNQLLINHIMEFDAQGKEYDWYEQHIALTENERR